MPETQRQKFARRLLQMDETTRLHNDDEDRAEKMLGAAPLEGTPTAPNFEAQEFVRNYRIERGWVSQEWSTPQTAEICEAYAAAVSKNSREELEAQMEIVRTFKEDNIKMYEQLEAAEARISELEARLAVRITAGTESHWRGREIKEGK